MANPQLSSGGLQIRPNYFVLKLRQTFSFIEKNVFLQKCYKMAKKNQSKRLTAQHKESHGVIGIFGEEAKLHDMTVGEISHHIIKQLEEDYPQLTVRYRSSIEKKEINEALKKVDPDLGQTLFVENASIIPDGGII